MNERDRLFASYRTRTYFASDSYYRSSSRSLARSLEIVGRTWKRGQRRTVEPLALGPRRAFAQIERSGNRKGRDTFFSFGWMSRPEIDEVVSRLLVRVEKKKCLDLADDSHFICQNK